MNSRFSLILLIKVASALQSWGGGHCPVKMAARMVAIHWFEGPTLNAINATHIAGILLIAAGLLGLAVGGFSFISKTRQARPGPLGFSIKDKETLNFPARTSVAADAMGDALLRCRRQEGLTGPHAPHVVSSLPPRGPPAAAVALAQALPIATITGKPSYRLLTCAIHKGADRPHRLRMPGDASAHLRFNSCWAVRWH